MNRGSIPSPSRRKSHHAGFNEAPIHESGKFRYTVTDANGQASFNEAPIHESGKSEVEVRRQAKEDVLQ